MKRHLDSYGLPGRILVRLTEDRTGSVYITPVSKRWAKRVGESNAYNGASNIFIQGANVSEHVDYLPKAAFYGRGKEKRFNHNAKFFMDSWTFRHMVGGQSD